MRFVEDESLGLGLLLALQPGLPEFVLGSGGFGSAFSYALCPANRLVAFDDRSNESISQVFVNEHGMVLLNPRGGRCDGLNHLGRGATSVVGGRCYGMLINPFEEKFGGSNVSPYGDQGQIGPSVSANDAGASKWFNLVMACWKPRCGPYPKTG